MDDQHAGTADTNRRLISFAVFVLLTPLAYGHHRLSRDECKRLKDKMERLQSRLRQGHSASQARRYRRKMRELQLRRFRKC
jgi:hypothetical protein